MLVIILQIYTNSLQYTQISIETIFDQISTYSLFSQIWYNSIFDHFPKLENFSIIFLFFYFSLTIIFLLPFSIKFRLQFSIKFNFPIVTMKRSNYCQQLRIMGEAEGAVRLVYHRNGVQTLTQRDK